MGVQEILRNQKFGKAVFMLHGIDLFNCLYLTGNERFSCERHFAVEVRFEASYFSSEMPRFHAVSNIGMILVVLIVQYTIQCRFVNDLKHKIMALKHQNSQLRHVSFHFFQTRVFSHNCVLKLPYCSYQ